MSNNTREQGPAPAAIQPSGHGEPDLAALALLGKALPPRGLPRDHVRLECLKIASLLFKNMASPPPADRLIAEAVKLEAYVTVGAEPAAA